MNHLLKTVLVDEASLTAIKASIHLVAVDTDLLFVPGEIQKTYVLLKAAGARIDYSEIQSVHGHDAFLIEGDRLSAILEPIFNVVPKETVSI